MDKENKKNTFQNIITSHTEEFNKKLDSFVKDLYDHLINNDHNVDYDIKRNCISVCMHISSTYSTDTMFVEKIKNQLELHGFPQSCRVSILLNDINKCTVRFYLV
jgi:hypothetical protein